MHLVLDNIRSAENVGNILRSADAFGVEKVYLCGITPAPIDRFGREFAKVTKAALGAEKTVAWEQAKDVSAVTQLLKGEGFVIAALEQHANSVPLNRLNNIKKLALVVGNEVGGVDGNVLAKADMIFEIPMGGKKESLNVAVATGIALFVLSTR